MLAQITRTQIGTLEGCPIYCVQKYNVLRIEWVAAMKVCCDGSPTNPDEDKHWQAQTAYCNNGKFLDPYNVPYIVVPPLIIEGVDPVVLGSQGCIVNLKNGLSTVAICGEVGPDDKLGEASCEAAGRLGLSSSPNNGGTDEKIILFAIWPGQAAVVDSIQYKLQPS
jgi:Fungal chitosanase of glycosyl hydrolase group 75